MTNRRDVAHLLRRLTFGPTAAEVDAAANQPLASTVDALLAPVAPPALPDVGAEPRPGTSRDEKQKARQERRQQVVAATDWWLTRMTAGSPAERAAEKLTFFWHGHWATSAQKVQSAHLMLAQQQTFRRYGTGDTGPLVRAMLRDPALIVWLDGQKNTAKAPNENLARELMELFTLGVGHYSEDDVKAGARVLTGWTVDRQSGEATFVAKRHAPTPVTLLGRTGTFDADSYADLLVNHPQHVPYLISRFWIRFAAESAPPSQVPPGRNATDLLKALVLDPAFAATNGQLVKQPVEWVTGAVRQLGADPAKAKMIPALKSLGQVPFLPPSVGGWPVGAAWLTTSSTQARLRLGQALTALAPQAVDKLAQGDQLAALADLLVIDGWSDRTNAALKGVIDPKRLLALGLASPEYAVH